MTASTTDTRSDGYARRDWWGESETDSPSAGHDPHVLNDREEIIAYSILVETAAESCPIARRPPESDADLHDVPQRVEISDPELHIPYDSIITAAGDYARPFGQHPNRRRYCPEFGYISTGPHLEDRPAEDLRQLVENTLVPYWREVGAIRTDDQAEWVVGRAMFLKKARQKHDIDVLSSLLKRIENNEPLVDDSVKVLEIA